MPVFLIFERTHPFPPPACLEEGGILSLWPTCLELFCRFQQQAEQCSAIVIQQLDEPCLVDEPPELDELPGAGASLLHPVACVGPVLCEHEPIPQNRQALELRR